MRFSLLIAASALASFPSVAASFREKRQNSTQSTVKDWDDIAVTADLNWVPCFDNYTCTKLRVPLDYGDVSAGTTHVAFIKWTAKSNSTAAANATRDLLLNPGGPGGSGVELLLQSLELFQANLPKDFNLIGFDPRGVSNSGPDLSCFRGERNTYSLYNRYLQQPIDKNDKKSYGNTFQRAAAFGDFCSRAHAGQNSTAKYVNTVATANDMLYYTEKLASIQGQDPKKSQLYYYGVSYGTILGTTFASLFPDRVGRIAVDGVVDGEDYYQGKWMSNVVDGDAAVRYFFQTCFDAGKSNCTFWADSPEAIEARYQRLVAELTLNPIPISTLGTPDIITVQDLQVALFQVPYNPVAYSPGFAELLVQLEKRSGEALANITGAGHRTDSCAKDALILQGEFEPRQFIACTDANGRYNLSSYEAFVDHANAIINTSYYTGETWVANTAVFCRSLQIRAPRSQVFEGYPGTRRTINPLLFLSTRIDPVTPLRSAQKMVARFGGARLLVQDNVGHATVSNPSKCVAEYLRKYLKDGTLPPEGTVCKADQVPFQSSRGNERALKRRSPI